MSNLDPDGGGLLKGVGGKFAGGFFGCLGVVAAIVLLVVGLLFVADLNHLQSEGRPAARDGAMAPAPSREELACMTTVVKARGYMPGWLDTVTNTGAAPVRKAGAADTVICPVMHGGLATTITVRLVCEDPREARCVRLPTEKAPRR